MQARKITMEAAKLEYVKAVGGATGCLNNLATLQKAGKEEALEKMEIAALQEVSTIAKGEFKRYPQVDLFNEQFKPDSRLLRRKTLVIEGPSWVGKSEFAKAMMPDNEMLEVNCSNCDDEPPLGAYDATVHNGIVMDEMSAIVMVKNKKLFQAGPKRIDMSLSKTNCHSYRTFVWRKKIVVCSNKWMRQVKKLKKDDRKWIQKNTIYLKVADKMFHDIEL